MTPKLGQKWRDYCPTSCNLVKLQASLGQILKPSKTADKQFTNRLKDLSIVRWESSLILVNKILNDPNIQQSVGVLLHDQLLKALANEEIKLAVQELVKDVFLSESITETVRKVLGDAVSSDYVKSAAALAGTEATQG